MSNLIDVRQINNAQLQSLISGIILQFGITPTGTGGGVVIPSVFSSTTVNIVNGVNTQFLPYGTTYSGIPYVYAELRNDTTDPLLMWSISGKSTSGCYIRLSNFTTSSNYFVDLSSTISGHGGITGGGSGNALFSNATIAITSGVSSQFLPYGITFPSVPFVNAEMKNDTNDPILMWAISGKSTSGCYIQLSNVTTSPNYYVDLYSSLNS